MKTNLLTETLGIIGYRLPDVQFVMDGDYSTSWEEFAKVAENFNYDSGYGSTKVNENLKIVGSTWWIERHEYDGSEWWEFKSIPLRPDPGNITLEAI